MQYKLQVRFRSDDGKGSQHVEAAAAALHIAIS
jgi:hypothetical protein